MLHIFGAAGTCRPLAALLLLALLALLPGRARAEMIETAHYTLDMPEYWQKLQENSSDNLSITVFSTKNRDSSLTTVVGRNGGASVKTIAECFARQYQARTQPTVKKGLGTFTFADNDNAEGVAFVTVQDSLYMVVTMSGNLRKARLLLKEFSSKAYPELIPGI